MYALFGSSTVTQIRPADVTIDGTNITEILIISSILKLRWFGSIRHFI